ncbi:MAG: S8 family serine peptidase [Bdellovibrionales bacterium]|nr:S8 family serine peptidase [Bdellovibrionales bacterium]
MFFQSLWAKSYNEYLVRVSPEFKTTLTHQLQSFDAKQKVEDLGINNWVLIKIPKNKTSLFLTQAKTFSGIQKIQPNYAIKLFDNPSLRMTPQNQLKAQASISDNPKIPAENPKSGNGKDPLFNKQWGMNDIGVQEAWKQTRGNSDIIVAVIDTGVDYTHEDLAPNLWRNINEIAENGIDDDNNGYVDDIIGWDFSENDNKPFDFLGDIFKGGNPGHGTHCAGNVAARGENGKGIAGVAPNVKIMVLRFISDKGQGTTADAIKAIKYAVDNGAHISSNSWGSEGEDPNDEEGNQALRDAISYSEQHGRLFIAAAGNGHQGVGYNNDTDANPAYPASYDHDSIISVAAIDVNDNFGSFSNWGLNSVDIAAPGVKVFSTTVGNKYSDYVVPFLATWDGTSMATPHVAGAAALYWSKHPTADWQEVKSAILSSAAKLSHMSGKLVSGGKLDVKALLNQ